MSSARILDLATRQAALRRLHAIDDAAAPTRHIAPRPPGLRLPLSHAQQRLWFLDRLSPGNPFYNISVPCGYRGPSTRWR